MSLCPLPSWVGDVPEFNLCPHCAYQLRPNMSNAHMYEIRGLYDGFVFWQCPDCSGMWHRWEKGNPYRERVDRWLEKHPEFRNTYLLAMND